MLSELTTKFTQALGIVYTRIETTTEIFWSFSLFDAKISDYMENKYRNGEDRDLNEGISMIAANPLT